MWPVSAERERIPHVAGYVIENCVKCRGRKAKISDGCTRIAVLSVHLQLLEDHIRTGRNDAADEVLVHLGSVCPAGFALLVDIHGGVIGRTVNAFQGPWRHAYHSQSYLLYDPVIAWGLHDTGVRVWSDLHVPDRLDPVGMLTDAHMHGYRAVAGLSVASANSRSILEVLGRGPESFGEDLLEELLGTLAEIHQASVRTVPRLTAGEAEALRMIASGLQVSQVADRLGITDSAVKARLTSARKRLGAPTTFAAIRIAVEKGLIRRGS